MSLLPLSQGERSSTTHSHQHKLANFPFAVREIISASVFAGGNQTNVTSGLLTETTRQRVRRTTAHQQASASWRSAAESSWTQEHTGESRHGHPRYTRADFGQEAVGGSTSRPRARDTIHRHTRCEHGCRPPEHGSGAELRTTAVNDRVQACTNSLHFQNSNNDHSASFDRR